MSGRATADIEADVRGLAWWSPKCREAADRLVELDAKVAAIAAIVANVRDSMPCLDPGVPWDALADISGVLHSIAFPTGVAP